MAVLEVGQTSYECGTYTPEDISKIAAGILKEIEIERNELVWNRLCFPKLNGESLEDAKHRVLEKIFDLSINHLLYNEPHPNSIKGIEGSYSIDGPPPLKRTKR